MLTLITVLQLDLGVHYNLNRARQINFTRSEDLFLHGMIPAVGSVSTKTNGGTCVSMPVIYAAVGRRLGYPIKIVTTKGHVFARWDGPAIDAQHHGDHFNIEATGRGLTKKDDDYYRHWPLPVTEEEIQANQYLVSMTPKRELALFLATRGHNLMDRGQIVKGFHTYAAARRSAPQILLYENFMRDSSRRLGSQSRHVSQTGGGFGSRIQDPDAWMEEIRRLEAIQIANQRRVNRLHRLSFRPAFPDDPWPAQGSAIQPQHKNDHISPPFPVFPQTNPRQK